MLSWALAFFIIAIIAGMFGLFGMFGNPGTPHIGQVRRDVVIYTALLFLVSLVIGLLERP